MQNTTFAELLGCSAQKFVTTYWGKQHHINSAGATGHLHNLPTLAGLDDLYYSLEAAGERLGIVHGHAAPAAGSALIRPDGRVALDELHAAYRSGKTLLLTHLQNSHLGVARLARTLEVALHNHGVRFRKEIGANLFLTPPVAQGFKPHYDGHDVLIVQLAGSKMWTLFDQLPNICAGMEGDQVKPNELGEIKHVIELRQGDVLYLPRGVPHFAQTTALNSLHVTLSIVPLSWTDIYSEKLRVCGKIDCRLERDLEAPPLQITATEASELRNTLATRWLSGLHALPAVTPWFEGARDESGGIRLADGIFVDQRMCTEDGIEILLPGGPVKLGLDAAEVLDLIFAGHSVLPSSISLNGRSHDSKMRFFQKLVEIGVAEPVMIDSRATSATSLTSSRIAPRVSSQMGA